MSYFSRLPEGLQVELKAKKFAAVRYSSSVEVPEGTVDDALLFDAESEVSRDELEGKGYTNIGSGAVPVYFDWFCSKALHGTEGSDEGLVRVAMEMLESTKSE